MNYSVFLIAVLGLLAALAPVVNNMFSPAVPALASGIGVGAGAVQAGLSLAMIGLAVGQLAFGPLSDRLGRRGPLLVAMAMFVLSSAALLFVDSIAMLYSLRFVQGVGAAGAIVISRSMAADSFTDHRLLKAIAVINIINGLAPIVTPLAGGALVECIGWKGVFVGMLVVGLVMFMLCAPLRESLPPERRTRRGDLIWAPLRYVLGTRSYSTMLLHQALALALLFGNIAASSSIVMGKYGLTAAACGTSLAVNGIFVAIGAFAAIRFRRPLTGIRVCCIGMVAMSVATGLMLVCDCGFYAYEAALCLMLGFMGITLTTSTTLALEAVRDHAGTGSALFGAAGFVVGAVVSPLVVTEVSTSAVFVVSAVLSALFAALYPRQQA